VCLTLSFQTVLVQRPCRIRLQIQLGLVAGIAAAQGLIGAALAPLQGSAVRRRGRQALFTYKIREGYHIARGTYWKIEKKVV